MPLRFTLFNGLTLLIMGLTALLIALRFRGYLKGPWPLAYYVLLVAFWRVFEGSFSTPLVFAGLGCGLALRWLPLRGNLLRVVRALELLALALVFVRGIGLLLGWGLWF